MMFWATKILLDVWDVCVLWRKNFFYTQHQITFKLRLTTSARAKVNDKVVLCIDIREVVEKRVNQSDG